MKFVLVFLFLVSACQAPPPPLENLRLIDLTHSFDEQTIYWPTAEKFHLEKVFEGKTEGGYFYAANQFKGAEHGGTHMDAPLHFAEGKHSIDEIPLDQLWGPGYLIDVSDRALKSPDYQVSTQDLLKWEKKRGRIPNGAILLIRTGYAQFWPDRKKYLGTLETGPGAVAKLHFPGLHPNAARWLVQNRNIKAVGLDTASIDFGQSEDFPSHQILFEANIPALENLNLNTALPENHYLIMALPMKIKGGSGAPTRVIAILQP